MRIAVAALIALAVAGCATTRAVRPLDKGTVAVTASAGGPLSANLPTPFAFPVPISTVGAAYGASERTTVHGAVHPSGLAAFGLFAADAGAAVQLLPANGAAPRLMVDGSLVVAAGNNAPGDPPGAFRLFPDVQAVASWDVKKHAGYVGIDQFFQPFPTVRYHVSPFFGALFDLGRTDLQFEWMWLTPYADNRLVAAEFVGPFHRGATSLKLGLTVHLGKEESP